jgi:transcriptional regulator with XRE-family HTH domain
VDLKFLSPEEVIEELPAVLDKIPGVGRGKVSIMMLPEGVARLSIVSTATLLQPEKQMFDLLGRLVQHFEKEARGQKSYDPVIGRSLKEVRDSLGTPLAAVARQIQTRQSALSKWEAGVRMPRTTLLYAWCKALGLVCPPKTALVRVVDFSPELLRFLQEDPTRLLSLTPDEFEQFVANRLDRMGYIVTLTGASNRKDGGIDLIAVPKVSNLGSLVIAGQVKHHLGDQKTGRDAVDRLLAWKDSYFGVGLLVTNTRFTHDAVWTAQQERNARFLRLRDFTDLKRWLQDQWGTEEDWREIPDRVELAPGVVIEIPRPKIAYPLDDPQRSMDRPD